MYQKICFVAFCFLLGCAPVTRVNTFDNTPRSPTTERIRVFTSATAIPYDYKEIGLITVDDEGWEWSESELLNIAMEKCRAMGADGMIILSQDKQLDGYVVVGNVPVAINRRIIRASAITKIGPKKPILNIQNTQKPFSIADEIMKLKELRDKGILTDEEFQKQKKKLLNQ